MIKKILSLLFIFPAFLFGQTTKKDSLWLTLKPFVGQWKGEGGGDEIEEIFEIAEPGKEFSVYSKVKLVRQK
jgi:hypothetical protein